MDNYYKSVALFEEMEERKTSLAFGTVWSNKVGFRKLIRDLKKNWN